MLRLKITENWSQLWSPNSVSFLPKNYVNLILSETSIFTKSMLKVEKLRLKLRLNSNTVENQKPQYIANLLLKTLYIAVFLVPLAGLEPARTLVRGILSPLRLPIPPQRRLVDI